MAAATDRIMRGHASILLFLYVALSFAVFVRCSVREKRDLCPCILLLDPAQAGRDTVLYRVTDGLSFSFGDSLTGPGTGRIPVPRRPLLLSCYAADGWALPPPAAEGIVIPYGEPAPRLWLEATRLTAGGEAVRHPVTLHKAYCLLTLDVHGNEGPLADLPAVRIEGNTAGWSWDGTPLEGPFGVDVPVPGGICQVVLPRQSDASLMLDVMAGGTVRSFALGELLEQEGYDWTAPDLDDLTLYINYAVTDLSLTIERFPPEPPLEIVI